LTVQLAVLPAPASVQLVLSKWPATSVEENVTLPVGVLGLAWVSVTVAVQAVELASVNVDGTHETAVVVASGGGAVTVSV